MWKVRSSLAWRMARDFSRRSLQTLRNRARWRGGSQPSTCPQPCPKPRNFTSRKWQNKTKANYLGPTLHGCSLCGSSPHTWEPYLFKGPPSHKRTELRTLSPAQALTPGRDKVASTQFHSLGPTLDDLPWFHPILS